MNNTHPLALDPGAVRLSEHNLLDIEEMLGADSFTLDEDDVVFRRRGFGGASAVSWQGQLGDWLVRDGAGFWRIVSDQSLTVEITDPGLTGQVDSAQR